MKASAIFSEAWRNIRSGTTHALLLVLLTVLAGSALEIADVASIVAIEQKAEQFRDSGSAIRTLSAESSIDAASCNTLTSTSAIHASGAIAASPPITVLTLPNGSIPSYSVTPSFASVLGLDARLPDGVWIPESLADTLHATTGTTLETATGPLQIAGIYTWPQDGRDSRLNYAFLIPDASQTVFDECWAEIWPTSTEAEDFLRFAGNIGASDDTPLALSQVNKTLGTSFDGNSEYQSRLTQYTPVIAALIGLAIGYAGIRIRRLEYAGALHAGQRKSAALANALIEATAWVGVAFILSLCVLFLASRILSPDSETTLVATGLRTLVASAAGSFIGTAAASLLIRERHLFRYFKDR